MDTAYIYGAMETDMKASGNNDSNMAMALTFLEMAIFILAIIKTGSLMAMDSIYGLMAAATSATLKTDSSTERVNGSRKSELAEIHMKANIIMI